MGEEIGNGAPRWHSIDQVAAGSCPMPSRKLLAKALSRLLKNLRCAQAGSQQSQHRIDPGGLHEQMHVKNAGAATFGKTTGKSWFHFKTQRAVGKQSGLTWAVAHVAVAVPGVWVRPGAVSAALSWEVGGGAVGRGA